MMANYFNITTTAGSVAVNTTIPTGLGEMPALQLNFIQRINRIVCSAFGIPLNILVVVVILRSRQLWSPRNIFWFGVTLFNVIAILHSVVELVVFYLHQSSNGSHETLCKMYATLVGGPYGMLLACLMLASWDRYLALARQQFYQNYVTTKSATLVLLFAFLAVTGLQTSPYWTGIFTVHCGIRYGWMAITLFYHGLLSSTCLVIQARLFIFIRKCVHYTPPLQGDVIALQLNQPSFSFQTSGGLQEEGALETRQQRINRLELRAARILGLGILPFCVLSLTMCVGSFVLILLQSCGVEGSWIKNFMLLSRELILVHLIYIPVVFITQSREFRAAIKRFYRLRKSQSVEQFG